MAIVESILDHVNILIKRWKNRYIPAGLELQIREGSHTIRTKSKTKQKA